LYLVPTRRNGKYSPTKATISTAFFMADKVVSECRGTGELLT
jgi:hypothetical protein